MRLGKCLAVVTALALASGCASLNKIARTPPDEPSKPTVITPMPLEEALASRVDIEFERIALEEILQFVAESWQLDVHLEPAHGELQVPYIHLQNVTLAEAMTALLRPLGLDFTIEGEAIVVRET